MATSSELELLDVLLHVSNGAPRALFHGKSFGEETIRSVSRALSLQVLDIFTRHTNDRGELELTEDDINSFDVHARFAISLLTKDQLATFATAQRNLRNGAVELSERTFQICHDNGSTEEDAKVYAGNVYRLQTAQTLELLGRKLEQVVFGCIEQILSSVVMPMGAPNVAQSSYDMIQQQLQHLMQTHAAAVRRSNEQSLSLLASSQEQQHGLTAQPPQSQTFVHDNSNCTKGKANEVQDEDISGGGGGGGGGLDLLFQVGMEIESKKQQDENDHNYSAQQRRKSVKGGSSSTTGSVLSSASKQRRKKKGISSSSSSSSSIASDVASVTSKGDKSQIPKFIKVVKGPWTPARLIGHKIKISWGTLWYPAVVQKYNSKSGVCKVVYQTTGAAESARFYEDGRAESPDREDKFSWTMLEEEESEICNVLKDMIKEVIKIDRREKARIRASASRARQRAAREARQRSGNNNNKVASDNDNDKTEPVKNDDEEDVENEEGMDIVEKHQQRKESEEETIAQQEDKEKEQDDIEEDDEKLNGGSENTEELGENQSPAEEQQPQQEQDETEQVEETPTPVTPTPVQTTKGKGKTTNKRKKASTTPTNKKNDATDGAISENNGNDDDDDEEEEEEKSVIISSPAPKRRRNELEKLLPEPAKPEEVVRQTSRKSTGQTKNAMKAKSKRRSISDDLEVKRKPDTKALAASPGKAQSRKKNVTSSVASSTKEKEKKTPTKKKPVQNGKATDEKRARGAATPSPVPASSGHKKRIPERSCKANHVFHKKLDPKTPIGNAAIGKRLRVYWPLEKQYFSGVVAEFNKSLNEYMITYDDGDIEWISFQREMIIWEK